MKNELPLSLIAHRWYHRLVPVWIWTMIWDWIHYRQFIHMVDNDEYYEILRTLFVNRNHLTKSQRQNILECIKSHTKF